MFELLPFLSLCGESGSDCLALPLVRESCVQDLLAELGDACKLEFLVTLNQVSLIRLYKEHPQITHNQEICH